MPVRPAPLPAPATIELGSLLRQYQLELVLITGSDDAAATAARPVQWVHGSDMRDPTPFLTPRTVLLTTGTQFTSGAPAPAATVDSGSDTEHMRAYVERLRDAGITALGFGVGIVWERIPAPLISACDELGLPLFRVPYATPFIAIVQTAAQLLGAHAQARSTWAIDSQRAVANAAAQRDGLSAVVREAASRLGRWVAVADRTGRIVEAAPPGAKAELSGDAIRRELRSLISRGTRASRVRGFEDDEIEMQTLGRSGRLLGVLLSPATEQDHAERTLLGLIAALATVQLEHRAGLGRSETMLRSAALQLLIAGELELAERVAAGVIPRLPRGRISVVRLESLDELGQGLIDDLRSLATRPGLLTAPLDADLEGGGAVLICEGSQLEAVRRALSDHDTPAGVSRRGGMDELPELLAQAGTALERAIARGERGPLTYAPALHAGVLHLLDSPEARRLAEGLLAPLREHDRRHDEGLTRALVVWLSHHGQTSPAAAELGIHRHTLRARIQSAATLLQRDLDDPSTRAELWAALRLTGHVPEPASAGGHATARSRVST